MDVIVLSIVFGVLVGFTMGLTGGGGSLLAVPLLIYGLRTEPRAAFGISLAVVGVTALMGAIGRLRKGEVDVRAGVIVAACGILGAPAGTWTAGRIEDDSLLIMFSSLMLLVAVGMWRQSMKPGPISGDDPTGLAQAAEDVLSPEPREQLLHFVLSMAAVGFATGFLSGMFGVGGGFILVPSLVFFAQVTVHRAVATSLFVMVLVSISGVTSYFAAGRGISLKIAGFFIVGGLIGMHFGSSLSRRLSPRMLQRILAIGISVIAVWILVRSMS